LSNIIHSILHDHSKKCPSLNKRRKGTFYLIPDGSPGVSM
jgi:hypothetical protein